MNCKNLKYISLSTIVILLLLSGSFAQDKNDDKFRIIYDEEKDVTSVILNGIELPKNKESFSVGASFEFIGKIVEKETCCVVLFFTSMSEKKFKYKENHNLKIWADHELFDFGEVNWQESYYGYAFILSGIAYPEEIFVGMETEKFQKIANAKKATAQLGNFKFDFTKQQLKGFRKLIEKMKP